MAFPNTIMLSSNITIQGAPVGSIIGIFTASSTNPLDTFTFTMTNDAGGRFDLLGDQLLVRDPALIDFSSVTTYNIIVMATSNLDNQSNSSTFMISVIPDVSLNVVIQRINPTAILTLMQSSVVIVGENFAISGLPTVTYKLKTSLSSTIADIARYNNNNIEVILPPLEFGTYIFTVTNGNRTEDSSEFLVYKTEQPITFATGNGICYTKPNIQLVFDENGPSGAYGETMRVSPPNPNMYYVQVIVKYNSNINVNSGGLLRLNGIQLIPGDKVWLSNQYLTTENGIWTVSSGPWVFDTAVTNSVFVDLGARAFDKSQGDLTRHIITEVDVDFGKVGAYTITYFVMNCKGVLSNVIRRVQVLAFGASINPTNSFAVTDYQILPIFDPALTPDGNLIDECPNTCDSNTDGSGGNGGDNNQNCECDLYVKTNGSRPFTGNQSMGNNKLTNLAPGQTNTDAVNLYQLLTIAQNISAIKTLDLPTSTVIEALTVVYVDANGLLQPADYSDLNTLNRVIGITTVTSNSSNRTAVLHSGTMPGFAGLTPGAFYFFDTVGQVQDFAPPSGYSQVIGIAINTTTMMVNLQIPIILP
jgi:hypothetical protein